MNIFQKLVITQTILAFTALFASEIFVYSNYKITLILRIIGVVILATLIIVVLIGIWM